MTIGVFSAICEEDRVWIDQYLAEVERLGLSFAIHLDRCSADTSARLMSHRLCVGCTVNAERGLEFNEMHKQGVLDIIAGKGFKWAMAWDVDETYEREAPHKLAEIDALDVDYIDVTWVNLWDDPQHMRVDGPFQCGHRVKFLNLKHRWRFTHPVVNGAKIVDARGVPTDQSKNPQRERQWRHDLVCLHWGMMTHEMRVSHKQRWDRIYTKAVGNQPYGFWDYALSYDQYPPTVVEHGYL